MLISDFFCFCPSDWVISVDRDIACSSIDESAWSTFPLGVTSPSRYTKIINVGCVSWVNGVSNLHPITFFSIFPACRHPHITDSFICLYSAIFKLLYSWESRCLLISDFFRFCPSDFMIYVDRDEFRSTLAVFIFFFKPLTILIFLLLPLTIQLFL